MILQQVKHQHASRKTVMHALFMYYFLGVKCTKIAHLLCKSVSTISNWIDRFETSADYQRKHTAVFKSFSKEHQAWVVDYYKHNPIAFLDEAKKSFEQHFKKYISVSTIWRIIHKHGYTWKVLELRAMQIRQDDIYRFFNELSSLNWSQYSVEFLDEVSFDSRGMLRKRGYAIKGQKLCFRGEFDRKPRVSLLCFINVTGVVQVFDTFGTFDRHAFEKCWLLMQSSAPNIQAKVRYGSWMEPASIAMRTLCTAFDLSELYQFFCPHTVHFLIRLNTSLAS
ncbi:hypothetical protein LEN26_014959 [Aphanomyces euteiches]|nr:hypothetical protein LEN26_014959 [Aphanomyces euteiches]